LGENFFGQVFDFAKSQIGALVLKKMSATDLATNSTNLSSSVCDLASTSAATKTMSTSAKYEILRSLSDIKSIRDLSEDAVRDILRHHTRDGGLVSNINFNKWNVIARSNVVLKKF